MLHRITLVLALVLGSVVAAQAQRRPAPRQQAAPPKAPTMKDGAIMQGGKVVITRFGQTETVAAETTLPNGIKVSPDGTVTMQNGTTSMMKEGDYLSLSGRLTTAAQKAEQDSLIKVAMEANKVKIKAKRK